MKIRFDFWGERVTYEGPDEPPPIGCEIATQGTEAHPARRGYVREVLPTNDGYEVKVLSAVGRCQIDDCERDDTATYPIWQDGAVIDMCRVCEEDRPTDGFFVVR